jgi:hypothetical protein
VPDRKLLSLRRDGACAECGIALPAGTHAYWDKGARVVVCVTCGADAPPDSEPTAASAPDPGGSTQREYERRRQGREQRARGKGWILAWAAQLSSGPEHERSWARGAEGEQKNAQRLEKRLVGKPVVLLHDRRVPGTRSNIDHIAVGPGGVTVIDSKNLIGKVKVDWQGGLFSKRRFDLYVGGRKRTNLVEGVQRQMAVVADVLAAHGFPGVPIAGALCMAAVGGLPLIGHPKLHDVTIDGARHVAKLIARAGPLAHTSVLDIAKALEGALPPA